MASSLPQIPAKRYFTIGEVADLCDVKPHVLRYWEQEFTQLRPMKRRGNRRYYQHHEVLMIRRIRELLYEQGFTINGARNRLRESRGAAPTPAPASTQPPLVEAGEDQSALPPAGPPLQVDALPQASTGRVSLREELLQIRELLLFQ
ncbi:MerR family transcriptional regulator [Comamonas composti]|uniref:MerR family transcriptional regulator n=1 Tax=Comamonas composti TaxID=408558 RepID=UPI00047DF15E|nr:MerR family transcriptional regulator [Comamonas composti]